jgi:DNA-binding NarL/FixJ family response regulator
MLSKNRRENKTLKREVSPKDLRELQKNGPDHWTWKRAEIIRLASEGYNNLEIQEVTGVNEKNIRVGLTDLTPKVFQVYYAGRLPDTVVN